MTREPGVDPLQRGLRLRGFLVVLADDTGHRALPVWVAEEPGGISLPDLLDRPADDIWTTASVPEELAVRLAHAVGGNVTGVEIYPVTAEPEEVNADTCAARIELGARHVTARLDQGVTLAVVAGAPLRVDGAVMDRLAVPVPAGDPAAPFRSPPIGGGHVIIDRREGRVLHVPAEPLGERPRFEPRNMAFAGGLDRWHLDGSDYSATAEDSCAILSSAVPEPSGSAVLLQTVFADDFRGTPVVFCGEFRTENVAGGAGLCLRILGKGWDTDPDQVQERVVTAVGSRDWSREQISVWVPENTDIVRFGIMLTGSGRVWLRNPELRRDDA
ncbi:MAG: hypothetical protein ACRDOH_00600 [Streptosporangiaceae bacterium]